MILPRYLYISTCSNYLWLKLTQNCGCLPKHITFDLASFTIIWLLAQNVYRPFNCLGKPFGVSENRLRSSAHNKCTNTVLEIHTPTLQSKYCFKSDMHFRKRKPLATPPWLTPISLWIIGLGLELRFTRKSVFVYTFLRVSTTRPFNIWIYGVVCVQLAHLSIGDWKDISIAHVIIIIKSEVSAFPIVIIFFRCCVPEMFVTSCSVTYYIYIPGKPGICFHYYYAVYDECKYSDTFWHADRTRLFVQYTISLSSLCKLLWRHWTYRMPVRYILSKSVWVRLSIFSPLSIMQYVGLYVFSLPISLVLIERICILCLIVNIKSEVWTITHCLRLGHETMVPAACLSIFLLECLQTRHVNLE